MGSNLTEYEQDREKRVKTNSHFWKALEEYLSYLNGKYGSEWMDSMLDESERLIIFGFRELSMRDCMRMIN